MNLGIEGEVALVAGGTSGLGLAAGRALAAEGAAVALCGRRVSLAKDEAKKFRRGAGVAMDLTDQASIDRAVAETQQALGPISIVVLNSGGPPPSDAVGLDLDVARSAAELLLYGPLRIIANCLDAMREQGKGRIVAIGSAGVQQPIPGLTTSGMFRAALASYLKILAEEVAKDGITVNMVHPGRIATDRITELDGVRAQRAGLSVEAVRTQSESAIPIGRYGNPDEFGGLVAFLCADAARYITGEQFRVDGGLVRGL